MARRDARNKTRYWCDPRVPGVSLLRAEFTTYQYVPHIHDTYVLAATETGGAAITSRGQTVDASPSTIFLANPMEPQAASMRSSGPWRYRALYLSDSAALNIARALGLDHLPYFVTSLCTDAGIADAIISLHRALEETTEEEEQTDTHMRLIDTMGALIEHHGTARYPAMTASNDVVRRVISTMHDRYADRLRLEDLSAPIGVSPFQLIALFKRTIGMTPYTYLTQVRLREARQSLLSGHALAYVAAASGFYDQSAFTRHFKRSYGITPLQFAAAVRARA